jgi:hypothetical protein
MRNSTTRHAEHHDHRDETQRQVPNEAFTPAFDMGTSVSFRFGVWQFVGNFHFTLRVVIKKMSRGSQTHTEKASGKSV